MDGKDFAVRLKKIKAEILALKQYTQLGLNRTNFTKINIDESISDYVVDLRIILQIDSTTDSEPYISLEVSDYQWSFVGVKSWVWDNEQLTLTLVVRYVSFYQLYARLGIISTKPVKNYTVEEL